MSDFSLDNIIKEEGVAYKTSSPLSRIEIARRGISKKSLLRIAEWCSVSLKQLSELLPVSLRTIQRFRNEDLLDQHITERALLIVEVLEKGIDVFGSPEKVQNWLHTPLLALGQNSPFSLLDTSLGTRLVMDTLGRIEHGVYS